MKITVLSENTACRPDVLFEHGLSLYIETDSARILFDMGQSDLFCQNAKTLGIDLAKTDLAVISHGHYDHGGGFAAFRKICPHTPVYVSPHAFGQFYSTKYIGLPSDVKNDPHILPVMETVQIARKVTLYSGLPTPCDKTVGKGLYRMENGTLTPDGFDHEIYLMIEENGKKVLFCGCSHKGAPKIVRYFSPDIFFGGFHLKNLCVENDAAYLKSTAQKLLAQPNTLYYTCHCTGKAQFSFLKKIMKDKLHSLCGGDSILLV